MGSFREILRLDTYLLLGCFRWALNYSSHFLLTCELWVVVVGHIAGGLPLHKIKFGGVPADSRHVTNERSVHLDGTMVQTAFPIGWFLTFA